MIAARSLSWSPGERAVCLAMGENGGAAHTHDVDDLKDASTGDLRLDQTEPTPCSKNTTGTQTIDADHTDKEKGSKPVEGAETDKVFWWRRRDGQDGKGTEKGSHSEQEWTEARGRSRTEDAVKLKLCSNQL
ncbi:hypothetical protein CFC21_097861 [Triticum aestivum]|uniref:Uncharacterized protein n=2 Tax=Triticum aestivum TaxID=4565 RepID=A0A3B6RF75_WHEAT|nr:uncharacterized protein LOC119332231 isoform X2 [Triticum dicoccoides]XP_044427505.1 uncharacterized protein LOC123151941 isoform X2 [Triticum aestivum]KAF7095764.1 hypothetical protein CFC21_097861 [Triticum aestivum]